MNANSTDEIKIKLSTTNQSGMVAALHLIAHKFDVKVKDNLVSKVSRDRNRVVVIFEGTLNATQIEFTNAIESHSRIYSIDEIEVKPNLKIYSNNDIECETDSDVYAEDNNDFESIVNAVDDIEYDSDTNVYVDDNTELEPSDKVETKSEEKNTLKVSTKTSYKFNTNDSITEESIEKTEKIMIDLLGPVASLFVSSAIIEVTTIGELFLLLSEELDGEVKSNFIGLVEGLKLDELD